jgi:MoxR-like ATPase
VPTRTAWTLGLRAANLLIERHLQEHGEYPRAVGLSVWGTATMRTGGDDIAQAMALLGVRPKWAQGSHRVVDFEILPMANFGRPRVDVTLRVSGFFRDAFSNLVALFDAAVRAVADLDEPADVNPIRARVLAEQARLQAEGAAPDEARERAGWRVFGARPGDYGTGLQALIDGRQWQDDADLAHAYLHAGGYAYGQRADGIDARDAFATRLAEIDAVVQNQDNHEHDLLDANDYYQFQGGMVAAVRHLGGEQPAIYHGDHANPAAPRVRTLGEEIARVIRARVVNPKWMDGARRHGYKGAFEMAATVDYLFGYDATTRVVGDHQYALVADAYVHDPVNREFLARHNPRALAELLPHGHFVTLPLGASEEQLTGTLDLSHVLQQGEVRFAPGLLARAHEGVLYVDEVNLLPDPLVDQLLDVAASGVNVVERDGVSHQHAARFVLVGTMNPEEGELRPQLLDRFGLALALDNYADPATRQAIVRARLAFDTDPEAFRAAVATAQQALAAQVARARGALGGLDFSDAVHAHVSALCLAAAVDGVRADLVMLRAARALAAWDGAPAVTVAHVDAVAELVLHHRRHAGSPASPEAGQVDSAGERATAPAPQDNPWGAMPPPADTAAGIASIKPLRAFGNRPPKKA